MPFERPLIPPGLSFSTDKCRLRHLRPPGLDKYPCLEYLDFEGALANKAGRANNAGLGLAMYADELVRCVRHGAESPRFLDTEWHYPRRRLLDGISRRHLLALREGDITLSTMPAVLRMEDGTYLGVALPLMRWDDTTSLPSIMKVDQTYRAGAPQTPTRDILLQTTPSSANGTPTRCGIQTIDVGPIAFLHT